jgi:hypothetical protein
MHVNQKNAAEKLACAVNLSRASYDSASVS